MASAPPGAHSTPSNGSNHARGVPPLDRVLALAVGLRRLWHLVDTPALAWMVAEVDSAPLELLSRRRLRRALELLRDDPAMPPVLRAALAHLVVRAGLVPAGLLLRSRHTEVRLAARLCRASDP